jgi:hypothetical protein
MFLVLWPYPLQAGIVWLSPHPASLWLSFFALPFPLQRFAMTLGPPGESRITLLCQSQLLLQDSFLSSGKGTCLQVPGIRM